MPDAAPQPPAPEKPRKPSPPPADAPSPRPDTAAPKPAEEGALFRALVDAGAEAMVAYTAEQRMYTMTSELVGARLQPLLSDMRQMREIMATKADLAPFATKADLARFATKEDLARFATKEDLARFATKEDLARFATKEDLAERDVRIMKWVFGALMAQAALIVTLIKLFP